LNLGKLDMSAQDKAYTNLVNVAAAGSECSGKGTRVVPGNADGSLLYLKVSADAPPCGGKMPLGLTPIPKTQADMIDAWIADGAKNN
jgi:hypothetical protein